MADLPDWLLALLQGQQPQPAGPIAPAGGPPSMSSLMPNPPWAPQGLLAQGPSDAPPAFSYVNPNSPALGGSPEPLDTSYGAPGQPYRLPGTPPSWAGLLPSPSPEPLDTSYGAPGQPYRLPGSPPTWAGQLASMPNLGAAAGSADVPLPPPRPGDLSGFRATVDRPQVASEGDVPDTPTPAQPLNLGQAAASPTSNVYGTPASGAPEVSSGLGGILGKVGDAIGGIYGAGGPGDALIALGLSNRTGGKSIEALNAAGNQRLNQAKLAAFNLQMQQAQQAQNATFNYLKSKGAPDDVARAAVLDPAVLKNAMVTYDRPDKGQFTMIRGQPYSFNPYEAETAKALTPLPTGQGQSAGGELTKEERQRYGIDPDAGPYIFNNEGIPTPVAASQDPALKEKEATLGRIATSLDQSKLGAIAGVRTIESINRQRDALDKGALTGSGAELITNFRANLAQALGITDPKVIASQEFDAAAKAKGAELARAVAGTGHTTNMDIQLGQAISGGNRNQMEQAIKSVLDANETLARESIKRHNEGVNTYAEASPKAADVAKKFYNVPEPSERTPPQTSQGSGALAKAREAIAAGAPRQAVINRLLQNGINPADL